ncbi:MAG: hypothetical protein PHT96_12740 [Syntrophorhabdaceae bacterium]|nr:hypothetical protein [Syntrophorhabdaceae bacterium]MDD4197255.1 hypothetical protein [Syntrophorhabdaceae bacterium]
MEITGKFQFEMNDIPTEAWIEISEKVLKETEVWFVADRILIHNPYCKDTEYDLEKLVMDSLLEPVQYYEEGQKEEIKKKIIKNLEKLITKLKNV